MLRLAIAALLLATSAPVLAGVDRAEPLDVPSGRGLRPESAVELAVHERVERGARDLRERGFDELPVLARALLDEAQSSGSNDLVEQARDLAPRTPAVRFEVARRLGRPADLAAALAGLFQSFPSLVWLLTASGAALGLGLLLVASAAVAIGFVRTVSLHGHALGHLTSAQDPPSWPGVLIALSLLALIPLAGIGPAGLVAATGFLAALRARPHTSLCIAGGLVVIGLILGPGLDYWARIAVRYGEDTAAVVAWRVDRQQPLPGDRTRLERALAREPDNLLWAVALATSAKREGDLAAARELLASRPENGSAALHAHAANSLGILDLADGDVKRALSSFEDARSIRETAVVLYNLSQAYARGVRLMERTAPFTAARKLDPELVSRYTAFEGKNVHRFVIHGQIPLASYLERVLAPSARAGELAHEVRLWTLGPGAPTWSWIALALLGVAGFALRRTGIARCSRCERPVCDRCAPDGASGGSCVRCAKLFARGANSDPRVRQRQLELDRSRQRRIARFRALLALLVPGAARVFDGRAMTGSAALLLAGTGAALLSVPLFVPVPYEIGGLGHVGPVVAGAALLVPAYLWSLIDVHRYLAAAGVRR